jgi:3',5'-nucleoside bisphosphate phosphatase
MREGIFSEVGRDNKMPDILGFWDRRADDPEYDHTNSHGDALFKTKWGMVTYDEREKMRKKVKTSRKTKKDKSKYIDLHIHTTYSDGQFTPEQVIEFSTLNGIDILAITDHDHLQGYLDAKEEAKKYGIRLIPGAEITTPDYHLLAFGFNPDDQHFSRFLEYSRELQKQSCEIKVQALRGAGIPITMKKIEREFPDSRLGKGNIRTIMQKDPACRRYLETKHPNLSPQEIYFHYLGKKGIASNLKPRLGVDPGEAINAVHAAGGIIGLAHPPKDIKHIQELEILVEQGIDFLEVQPNFKEEYPYHIFEKFAKEKGLPISYGSDYHGPTLNRPMLQRGENVLTTNLKALLNRSSKGKFVEHKQ